MLNVFRIVCCLWNRIQSLRFSACGKVTIFIDVAMRNLVVTYRHFVYLYDRSNRLVWNVGISHRTWTFNSTAVITSNVPSLSVPNWHSLHTKNMSFWRTQRDPTPSSHPFFWLQGGIDLVFQKHRYAVNSVRIGTAGFFFWGGGGFLTRKDGTDMLSRNVGKELLLIAA